MIRIQYVRFIPVTRLLFVSVLLIFTVCPHLYSYSNGSNQNSCKSYESSESDPLIRYAGNHAFLTVSKISDHTFSIILFPLESIHSSEPELPESEFVAEHEKEQIWRSRTVMDPIRGSVGDYTLEILRSPLRIVFRHPDDSILQELLWPDSDDGRLEMRAKEKIYGLLRIGQTGDGSWDVIKNEAGSDGSMFSPPAGDPFVLHGENGWTLFIAHPAGSTSSFTLDGEKGTFLPDAQRLTSPVQIFITLRKEPEKILNEYSLLAAPSLLKLLQSSGIESL